MRSGLDDVILSEIAVQSEVSLEEVQQHYQSLLADLHHEARIHDFIPLLAMKQVRQHFRPKPSAAVQPQPAGRQAVLRRTPQMAYALIG